MVPVFHHRDETLDATSAVRFHFGEVMISATVRAVFLILLSVPIESVSKETSRMGVPK